MGSKESDFERYMRDSYQTDGPPRAVRTVVTTGRYQDRPGDDGRIPALSYSRKREYLSAERAKRAQQ